MSDSIKGHNQNKALKASDVNAFIYVSVFALMLSLSRTSFADDPIIIEGPVDGINVNIFSNKEIAGGKLYTGFEGPATAFPSSPTSGYNDVDGFLNSDTGIPQVVAGLNITNADTASLKIFNLDGSTAEQHVISVQDINNETVNFSVFRHDTLGDIHYIVSRDTTDSDGNLIATIGRVVDGVYKEIKSGKALDISVTNFGLLGLGGPVAVVSNLVAGTITLFGLEDPDNPVEMNYISLPDDEQPGNLAVHRETGDMVVTARDNSGALLSTVYAIKAAGEFDTPSLTTVPLPPLPAGTGLPLFGGVNYNYGPSLTTVDIAYSRIFTSGALAGVRESFYWHLKDPFDTAPGIIYLSIFGKRGIDPVPDVDASFHVTGGDIPNVIPELPSGLIGIFGFGMGALLLWMRKKSAVSL